MRRIRKILTVLTATALIFPSSPLFAASNSDEGNYSSKDEVVYATLSPNGNQEEIYVVNTFDVKKAGKVMDYGSYTNVKNLTDLSELEKEENTIEFTAPEGKFYYQGNMEKEPLPWDISISYLLNGKKTAPEELAGQDGEIEIQIATSPNDEVDPVFFENYILQISLTLDPSIFTNIEAPDGMIANAGKNKQVSFTVMPEKEAELSLSANVEGFELNGIDINGVPSSMSIDSPDIDDSLSDMKSLTDAIREVNNGVSELESGVSELNGGVLDLYQGSSEFNSGLSEINGASSELVEASESINQALGTISSSLSSSGDSEEMDLNALNELPEGLKLLGENLNATADGLSDLRTGYTEAYDALDQAMEGIPTHEISEQEFKELYSSGANEKVLNKLKDTYIAAQTAKGTYTKVNEGFDAVDSTLNELSKGVKEMAGQLITTADELSTSIEEMDITESMNELQEGLTALSTNYKDFHTGLSEYTGGVNEISSAYGQLHDGIGELSNGTNELESGVSELHNGTSELYEATIDLPSQMEQEIDDMISDFENTDFEAKSFVSSKNDKKVNTVQFILTTESIELEKDESEEEPIEEEKGFWDRLWDLFS